jgi:triosephosphate isomerase
MHVRRKLVVGNWKMNGSVGQLRHLMAIADAAEKAGGVDVAICPPFTLIAPAITRCAGRLAIGAQDCHSEDSGAFTGSVSVPMIKEAGGRIAIVGHSERRAEQSETDPIVRGKAEAALRHGLTAIVCVGESEIDRGAGDQWPVVERQLAGSLPEAWDEGELVVAYEPVWAIGTGNVATPGDVTEMHGAIRNHLVERFGDAGNRIRILYGGSMKPDNAAELFACRDVDGGLVGGASLTAAQFVPIIEAATAS